jgi:hypothetical protein
VQHTARLALVLGALNLALWLGTVQQRTARAQGELAVLRGSALELVDARGQVRSRLTIEQSGEVVLRLLDEQGTIRVKLGADRRGSGLVLLDDATEPAVQLIARREPNDAEPAAAPRIVLRGSSGREQRFTPTAP